MKSEPEHVYFGSYSDNQKVPSLYDFLTKDLTALKINLALINPSFVYVRNSMIYLVEETNNGRLITLDSQYQVKCVLATCGNDPCHISMSDDATKITVTNYSSGSFAVFKLENFIPVKMSNFVLHQGSSTNPSRQSSPHPHSSVFSDCGGIMFVADLGTDTVYFYQLNNDNDALICETDKCLTLTGTGPRHLAKGNPGEKILFLSGELDSSIRVLSYNSNKLELLSAYKVSHNPSNYPSQVVFQNKCVYMACRGDNSMIVFDYEPPNYLKEKFRFKVGEWPRHFKISKGGIIYIACQFENVVQRFKEETGKVYQLGQLKISCPSCIAFEQ